MKQHINEFDFILGKWRVKNRRLKERLKGNDDWIEFEADYESWHVLNGLGNMDQIETGEGKAKFVGLSMRMFNPANGEWSIYWADTAHMDQGIKAQVKGTFDGKVGTFLGEDEYNNELVPLRFIWESKSEDHAYWEQAYFDKERGEWEVNWTMDFFRKEKA